LAAKQIISAALANYSSMVLCLASQLLFLQSVTAQRWTEEEEPRAVRQSQSVRE
jgi:hypothetical protein